MICKQCGNEISDGAKFCRFCGAPAERAEAVPAQTGSAETMICPSCGNELKAGNKFCVHCGATVERESVKKAEPAPEKPKAPLCPSCGKEIVPGNSFCIYCGAKVAPGGTAEISQAQHADKSTSKALPVIIAVAAAVVVIGIIAAVLAYFIVFRDKDGDGEEFNPVIEEMTNADGAVQENAVEDARVKDIEAVCRSIKAGISNGFYDEVMISSGIKAYYDADGLKAVVATNSMAYVREYYYDGGAIVYASYDGSDAHEFYFANGDMIIWNYTDESGNTEARSAKNASDFALWEDKIISEADEFVRLWEESTAEDAVPEYILEGSDSRYISESELTGFTKEECRLARNEIYARHGRKFEDESLTEYFSQFDWYVPTIEASAFTESMLNKYEIANRDLIVAYETKQGYR